MGSTAALTVIVPVRDVARFLPDALTSLQANCTADHQLIVVDDGSTDATPDVLAEFAPRLPMLEVLRHQVPVGLADARNAGLDRATGRYVTFLDGDDWIDRGYLARLVDAIDTLGCDFVRVDHVQVEAANRTLRRAPEARRGTVLEPRSSIGPATIRTMVDYPYAWAGIYRRDLGDLLRFPSGLHTAEDRPWIWRLHREARSYAVVGLAGVFYRRLVANSLTQIGDARQLHFLDAFALVLDQVVDEPDLQLKALRQFLAVLAHHLSLRARMTAPLRRELVTRAGALLAGWPPDLVHAAVPGGERARTLRPALPAAVRRPAVRAS